jgi:hypothetical protein
MPFMIDLCAGLKGASAAMLSRGWNVLTVDINPSFEVDIVADVRTWSWTGERPDLIWASPPCNEFSREFFVWSRTGKPPDLSIVQGCQRIISESKPRYWIIENTRGGAQFLTPLLGKPAIILYPYYLWGHLPPLPDKKPKFPHKELLSSTAKAERARIPFELSALIARAVEQAMPLFELEV